MSKIQSLSDLARLNAGYLSTLAANDNKNGMDRYFRAYVVLSEQAEDLRPSDTEAE